MNDEIARLFCGRKGGWIEWMEVCAAVQRVGWRLAPAEPRLALQVSKVSI